MRSTCEEKGKVYPSIKGTRGKRSPLSTQRLSFLFNRYDLLFTETTQSPGNSPKIGPSILLVSGNPSICPSILSYLLSLTKRFQLPMLPDVETSWELRHRLKTPPPPLWIPSTYRDRNRFLGCRGLRPREVWFQTSPEIR